MAKKDAVLTVSFSHDGVEIALSARVVRRDFRVIPMPGRGSTEQLYDVSTLAFQAAAQPLAAQVLQAHREFERALNLATAEDRLAWMKSNDG